MHETFSFNGTVEIFPQKGGWHFIRVPKSMTKKLLHKADRGVIAITATVRESTWETSLLPMGDGTHFIALNAKIRKREHIEPGMRVEVVFQSRS